MKERNCFVVSQMPFYLKSSTQRLTSPSLKRLAWPLEKKAKRPHWPARWPLTPTLLTCNLRRCGTEMVGSGHQKSHQLFLLLRTIHRSLFKHVIFVHCKHNDVLFNLLLFTDWQTCASWLSQSFKSVFCAASGTEITHLAHWYDL